MLIYRIEKITTLIYQEILDLLFEFCVACKNTNIKNLHLTNVYSRSYKATCHTPFQVLLSVVLTVIK